VTYIPCKGLLSSSCDAKNLQYNNSDCWFGSLSVASGRFYIDLDNEDFGKGAFLGLLVLVVDARQVGEQNRCCTLGPLLGCLVGFRPVAVEVRQPIHLRSANNTTAKISRKKKVKKKYFARAYGQMRHGREQSCGAWRNRYTPRQTIQGSKVGQCLRTSFCL
jgi:hypothetical protein